jgi:erythritol transport system ATP-binding protein
MSVMSSVGPAAGRPPEGEEHPVILRVESISKVFLGTVALDKVDFEARAGAVNVLVGENGAGKSTLMKILAGVHPPTAGRILLDGQEVTFSSVHDAAAQGIGIVFQELNLCPNLSIAENLFLTHPFTKAGIHIDRARQRQRAIELLKRLEHDVDPDTLVGDLPIGMQQVVEIAKALSEDVRVLIMDEPTSALSSAEVEVLFKVVEDLKRQGVAIIYISHRLEELVRIGDYITVLRDGRFQGKARIPDIDIPWIISEMVGPTQALERRAARSGPVTPVLRTDKVTLLKENGMPLVDDVSITINAGEVVGIYGLMGAGRSELFETLFGLHPHAKGSILLGEENVAGLSVAQRIRRGLFLVPEDRQRDGLMQNLSVAKNISMASLYQLRKLFWVDLPREKTRVGEMFKALKIKAASPDIEVTSLSGGNQQKVVIGKSLLTKPKLLLLDEPTRGIDIGAKGEVFRTMRRLADEGLGVVFATSDLKEIMSAADRILVMSRGRVTADYTRDEATEERLVAASTLGKPSASTH